MYACVRCVCVCVCVCARMQSVLVRNGTGKHAHVYQIEGDVCRVLLKSWREALCLPHLSREDQVSWENTSW